MLDTTRFEDLEATEVQVEEACIRERRAIGTLNPNQQQTVLPVHSYPGGHFICRPPSK
jgi:hypothetical protein